VDSLIFLSNHICNSIDSKENCCQFLNTIPASKEEWKNSRNKLKTKFTNGNIPSTTRQSSYNYIYDIINFFKDHNTDNITFCLDDPKYLPGLQVEALANFCFTSATIHSINTTNTTLSSQKTTNSKENSTFTDVVKTQSPSNNNSNSKSTSSNNNITKQVTKSTSNK